MPGPAADSFSTGSGDGLKTALTRRVESRFTGIEVDPCLIRAAEGFAHGHQTMSSELPLDFTEFVLHWAGCPDPSAAVSTLYTDSDGFAVLVDQLHSILDDHSYSHLGFTRIAMEEHRWQWVIFLVERNFSMRDVPSSADPGATVPILFTLDPGFTTATLYVTQPRGATEEYGVGLSQGWAVTSVPLAEDVGRHWVELLAEDERGPRVVALFPIEVGREPPAIWVGKAHADESWISDLEEAEAYAFELVNSDRRIFGLDPLLLDKDLARIARAHSSDMAGSDYFAHVSPTTGDISDRLRAEGYFTTFAMENLARSRSLAEAQEGLMRSPGHRAAILSHQVTHMGIGVMLQRGEDSGTAFLVTQIFSEPFAPASPDELAAQIAEAIRARRSSLYLSTPVHAEISALAFSLALSAVSDPQVFSTRKESIASTLREVNPSYNAWRGFLGTAFNADDVALPELLDDREIKSIGVGAAGSAGSPMEQPVTFVVLVAY